MKIILAGLTALTISCNGASPSGCLENPSLCGAGATCDHTTNQCASAVDMAVAAPPPMVNPWAIQPSGTTNPLNGVWGSDDTHVWVVGSAGTIGKILSYSLLANPYTACISHQNCRGPALITRLASES